MKIFPAIDIKDKKCVRLVKGDFDNKNFFFNKGPEQNFNKDLDPGIVEEINKKYKNLLLEFNYLRE